MWLSDGSDDVTSEDDNKDVSPLHFVSDTESEAIQNV